MSSLAASRADGYYYPPQYIPRKHGSINAFHNSHPLRQRARKISEGILTIRFEMPFKVWCLSCSRVIDQGVRFNAEKKRVDWYLSTPVYEFRMCCPSCSASLVIRTDPKDAKYVLQEGLREKVEEFSAADAETIALPSTEEREKIRNDPMYKLEVVTEAKSKADSERERIMELYQLQRQTARDNYTCNSQLRDLFRKRKTEEAKEKRAEEKRVRRKGGANFGIFGVPLLPETIDDLVEAKQTDFLTDCALEKTAKTRDALLHSSIFFTDTNSSTDKHTTQRDPSHHKKNSSSHLAGERRESHARGGGGEKRREGGGGEKKRREGGGGGERRDMTDWESRQNGFQTSARRTEGPLLYASTDRERGYDISSSSCSSIRDKAHSEIRRSTLSTLSAISESKQSLASFERNCCHESSNNERRARRKMDTSKTDSSRDRKRRNTAELKAQRSEDRLRFLVAKKSELLLIRQRDTAFSQF